MSEQSQYSQSGSHASGPRAGFWRRFVASLLDGIVIGIANVILLGLIDDNAATGIATLIGLGYYTYFEGSASGQTLGKKALGIRVLSLKDGGPIGYGRAFIRYIGRIVSAIPLLLGYFWMLWDKEKQTWHDKFAGSVVVPESDYPVSQWP
ncbi:MAG: RDD family protein [Actinobacteria bacterium]|nr:RDD family protein [Actinomycetota bacterium]